MGLKFGQTEKFKSIFRFTEVRYYYTYYKDKHEIQKCFENNTINPIN